MLCTWRIIPHLHFKLKIKRPAVQALFSWPGLDAVNPAFPSFTIIKTLDTYKSTFPGIVAQLRSESYMWTDNEVESFLIFFLQKDSGNVRKCILSSVWRFNLVTQLEPPALFRHCILFYLLLLWERSVAHQRGCQTTKTTTKQLFLKYFTMDFYFLWMRGQTSPERAFWPFPTLLYMWTRPCCVCVACQLIKN